ncbi:MAG: ester cyclase [Acidobacteriota bacterium]
MRRAGLSLFLSGVLLWSAALPVLGFEKGRLDRNKAVARKVFEDVLSRGRFDVSLAIHTPDFVAHAGAKSAGLEEDLQFSRGWRQAFPDLVVSVNQMVAEGDRVAVYWTARGTNTGAGNGLPATGKSIEATGITIFRFVEDRIAEEWNVSDELTAMRQLGLVPEAPAR